MYCRGGGQCSRRVSVDNLFSTIEDDAQRVLGMMKLTLQEVRQRRGTNTIIDKKMMLYCYLRLECKYSLPEIANYCHKDHTTIGLIVKKYKDKYKEIAHKLA